MNKARIKNISIKVWRVGSIIVMLGAVYQLGLPTVTLEELAAVVISITAVAAIIEWIK